MSLQPGATLGLTADDLVTGEAVALDLPAASLGMRMLSGLIDLFVLQMLASVVLTVAWMFVLRADDAVAAGIMLLAALGLADRWKWNSFVVWGLFCGAIYYPIFGAWTWGGGWLAKVGNSMHLGLGYVDFAGSGVVHAVGGVAGLAGAIVLGPRIGKFNKDGSANTLPGHHIPMAMLGTFILLFVSS